MSWGLLEVLTAAVSVTLAVLITVLIVQETGTESVSSGKGSGALASLHNGTLELQLGDVVQEIAHRLTPLQVNVSTLLGGHSCAELDPLYAAVGWVGPKLECPERLSGVATASIVLGSVLPVLCCLMAVRSTMHSRRRKGRGARRFDRWENDPDL